MVLEKYPVLEKHVDKNEMEISHANEDKMKEHLDKIKNLRNEHIKKNQKKLQEETLSENERNEALLRKENIEKLNDELFHKIIAQKGDKELNFWFRFKYGIIFGSVIFLVALYFLFWYISLDFKTVEDSFTTIFCVI